MSPFNLLILGNMVFGLGGTQALSLPMLTVLRRFSFVMTMGAEFYLLGVRPPFKIKLSVGLMILGATIAALNDLAFNLEGYAYILINDVCTAGTGVFTKKKLNSNDLGSTNFEIVTTVKTFYLGHFKISRLLLVLSKN